jgi:hypothetical protein
MGGWAGRERESKPFHKGLLLLLSAQTASGERMMMQQPSNSSGAWRRQSEGTVGFSCGTQEVAPCTMPEHALQVPQLDELLEVALHELKGDVVLDLWVVAVSQWARQDHNMSKVVHKAHHTVVRLEQVDL